MVEGHSVHRVCELHRRKLVGSVVRAVSPNGRFAEGAAAIDGAVYSKIIAIGKNLFAFFTKDSATHVVHVHFGMSGRWSIFPSKKVPDTTHTTRLVLEVRDLIVHLSAMTVELGDEEKFETTWRSRLGQDPLDENANPDKLWTRVKSSKKAISALLMDQAFFAGVGNIYRAEILFVGRVHPRTKGTELSRDAFDRIWKASVDLMQIGKKTGRIQSIDQALAIQLGDPGRRRYVYNQRSCCVCSGDISNYDEAGRTVWCCFSCQRMEACTQYDDPSSAHMMPSSPPEISKTPFNSQCAAEPLEYRRRSSAYKLSVLELRNELKRLGLPHTGKKADLALRLSTHFQDTVEHTADLDMTNALATASSSQHGYHRKMTTVSVPHIATPTKQLRRSKQGSTKKRGWHSEEEEPCTSEDAQRRTSSKRAAK